MGCRVDPFDASGKQCRRDDPCPSPLACVLTSASQTSSGGEDDGGAVEKPAQTGSCQILPCTRVVCANGEVCVADECFVPQCSAQACGPNEVCAGNQCVDRSCVGVACAAGTACAKGSCRPLHCNSGNCNADAGEVCFEEACADRRCIGVACPPDQGCAQGRCFPETCGATPCASGSLCSAANKCTERACLGVVCPVGLVCAGGACQRCASDSKQTADGGCTLLLDAGLPCVAGTDCKSTHCVNGACCEAVSCGVCQRCDVAGQAGACAAALDGGPGCGVLITHALNVTLDAWVVFVGNKAYGNGKGPRLVVGGSHYVEPVSETGLNRALLRIPLALPDGGLPSAGNIVSASLKLRVKPNEPDNSCWSTKSQVMFFVEALDGGFTENAYAVVCGGSANGAPTALWPGPAPIAANRAKYESNGITPSGWISVDLRPMVAAAVTEGKRNLDVRLIAAGAGTATDETTESRRLTVHSRESATPDAGPYLELKLKP